MPTEANQDVREKQGVINPLKIRKTRWAAAHCSQTEIPHPTMPAMMMMMIWTLADGLRSRKENQNFAENWILHLEHKKHHHGVRERPTRHRDIESASGPRKLLRR